MDKDIARIVLRRLRIAEIGDVMPLDEISVAWGISVSDIIESGKFIRRNGFDSVAGWEVEFSSDYKNIVKKLSFELQMREMVFNAEDNLKKE